jgi:lipase chaperone LimK|tara:strand:- start:1857 stop:2090 length:234 start_codon:yes stop_codon:yes gene_type:complete
MGRGTIGAVCISLLISSAGCSLSVNKNYNVTPTQDLAEIKTVDDFLDYYLHQDRGDRISKGILEMIIKRLEDQNKSD